MVIGEKKGLLKYEKKSQRMMSHGEVLENILLILIGLEMVIGAFNK